MIDFLSVSLHGVINHSRARVLWDDGLLRAFTVAGLILELRTSEPVRLSGFLHRWTVASDVGPLVLKGRCMTCGGPPWWRLMRTTAEELWETPFGNS